LGATLRGMSEILNHIAAAGLTTVAAAVFAAMVWAGSRIH
jgi:hypothetical protein